MRTYHYKVFTRQVSSLLLHLSTHPAVAACLIDEDISRAFLLPLFLHHTRVTFPFLSYYYFVFVLCESTSFSFSSSLDTRKTKALLRNFHGNMNFLWNCEITSSSFTHFIICSSSTGDGKQQKISLSSSAVNFTGFICGHKRYLHT